MNSSLKWHSSDVAPLRGSQFLIVKFKNEGYSIIHGKHTHQYWEYPHDIERWAYIPQEEELIELEFNEKEFCEEITVFGVFLRKDLSG